jgi:hypothetical protein
MTKIFDHVFLSHAALSPPLSSLVGDLIGISSAIIVVSLLTLANIPLAFALKRTTADCSECS